MRCPFLLLLVVLSSAAWAQRWGVRIGRDDAGHMDVVLENAKVRARYGWKRLEQDETFIRELVSKSAPDLNHAGDRIDAAANREELIDARIVRAEPDVQTVRLEWQPLHGRRTPGIEEVSVFRDSAALRIDYVMWPVNIVDIGTPGGSKTGEYTILGGDRWKREFAIYPKVYFCRDPKDIGQENVTEVDEAGPLDYHGWFIMGVANRDGHGFGRVVPVASIDIIKLLWNKGFELFPCSRREKKPFTSYLYPVTGGSREILAEGRRLADAANGGK